MKRLATTALVFPRFIWPEGAKEDWAVKGKKGKRDGHERGRGSMIRMIAVAVLSICMGVSAYAQDNDACLKAIQPKIDAFNACAKPQVGTLSKGDQAAGAVIDAAISACDKNVSAVRDALKASPCTQTDAQADTVVAGWLDQARTDMTAYIKELRGQ